MSLFQQHIHFAKPDPLANGLGDEIAQEQREADAIHTLADTSADELETFWSGVLKDVKHDPDWFDFSEE